MILNSVDLPQPEGPMIETNSPAAMENDTSSTAVITPSAVGNRLLMRSTSSRRDSGAGDATSAPCSPELTRARPVPASSRRNLDQFRQLFLRQRRCCELECHGVRHDRVEPDHLVRIDR